MDDPVELRRIDAECRCILKNPTYSKETCAQLIDWLRHPNAAISDIAGCCLFKLGAPAFNDLLAVVLASAPWPVAIWVLSGLAHASDQMLPHLRSWLTFGSEEIERQSAVSLAGLLIEQKRAGHAPDIADVTACLRIMERDSHDSASMRMYLREFRSGLAQA